MVLTKRIKKIVDENKEEIRQYLEEYDNWSQSQKDAGELWWKELKRSQKIMEKYYESTQ